MKASTCAASLTPAILARIAPRLRAEVLLEPEFRDVGRIRFPNGRQTFLVDSREAYEDAARAIFELGSVLLVQEPCPGRNYRIVVLNREIISTYERIPLHVVGNGTASLHALLLEMQQQFDSSGRDTELALDDPRISAALAPQHLSFDSVLPEAQRVTLLEVANLSCGVWTVEVTSSVHPTVAALAVKVVADLDLRFAGVDIILADATRTLGDYVVLKVNSAPGLDHYASRGPEHKAAIDSLYEKVLLAIARGL